MKILLNDNETFVALEALLMYGNNEYCDRSSKIIAKELANRLTEKIMHREEDGND